MNFDVLYNISIHVMNLDVLYDISVHVMNLDVLYNISIDQSRPVAINYLQVIKNIPYPTNG